MTGTCNAVRILPFSSSCYCVAVLALAACCALPSVQAFYFQETCPTNRVQVDSSCCDYTASTNLLHLLPGFFGWCCKLTGSSQECWCKSEQIAELQTTQSTCRGVNAVDGGWSDWQNGVCSVTCGGGTLTRTRTCTNPSPSLGGAACSGASVETGVACSTDPCVVVGQWSAWTRATTCTATCGNDGVEIFERSCLSAPCVGTDRESRACPNTPCPNTVNSQVSQCPVVQARLIGGQIRNSNEAGTDNAVVAFFFFTVPTCNGLLALDGGDLVIITSVTCADSITRPASLPFITVVMDNLPVSESYTPAFVGTYTQSGFIAKIVPDTATTTRLLSALVATGGATCLYDLDTVNGLSFDTTDCFVASWGARDKVGGVFEYPNDALTIGLAQAPDQANCNQPAIVSGSTECFQPTATNKYYCFADMAATVFCEVQGTSTYAPYGVLIADNTQVSDCDATTDHTFITIAPFAGNP